MSAAAVEQPGPVDYPDLWTEEKFLRVPAKVGQRTELLDGSLLLTPAASGIHQRVSRRLANLIETRIPDSHEVLEAVNVRVGPSRILIPDLIVTSCLDGRLIYDAADVVLAAEVVSPSTVSTDRWLKPGLYAAASIGWYLRVKLTGTETAEVIAYRLSDGAYGEHGRARSGRQVLRLSELFEVEIDPVALLRTSP